MGLARGVSRYQRAGLRQIDLGALPGVCDHVPTPLPPELVDALADQILASGVAVRLINADVAGMNDPGLDAAEIQRRPFHLELETRDITNDQRPAATARAAQLISGLI